MTSRALRFWVAACVSAIAAFALAGCDGDGSNDSTDTVVRISGSGTCLPLLRVLTDAYEREHNVRFVYLPGLHSSGGIKGVAHGDLDIGAVSRDLTAEEREFGLDYVPLSDDGLAVAVHPSAALTALSSKQLREVYEGRYANWSELGGADTPIVILDRNEDESAKMILRQYVLDDAAIAEDAIVLSYEQDMFDAIVMTEGAIGYFSLGGGLSGDIDVSYVALDGVAPTVDAIESGAYEMVRPLGVVVSPRAEGIVRDFIAWASSDDARLLLQEHGFARPLDSIGE